MNLWQRLLTNQCSCLPFTPHGNSISVCPIQPGPEKDREAITPKYRIIPHARVTRETRAAIKIEMLAGAGHHYYIGAEYVLYHVLFYLFFIILAFCYSINVLKSKFI